MSLSIALFQMDIVWQNPEVNLRRAEEFVRDAEADLVVLPEEFSTGFSIELTPSAEDMEGQTVAWMRSVACRWGKAVAGSIPSTITSARSMETNRFFMCIFSFY